MDFIFFLIIGIVWAMGIYTALPNGDEQTWRTGILIEDPD